MGDEVRATVGSGWPVLLAGICARAMINTVPEDHTSKKFDLGCASPCHHIFSLIIVLNLISPRHVSPRAYVLREGIDRSGSKWP